MSYTKSHHTTQEQIDAMHHELDLANQKLKGNTARPPFGPRRVISLLCSALFAVVVLILGAVLTQVLIAKSQGQVPQIFGYQLYRVETESMLPDYPVGSILLSRAPEDASALQVGDIITFTYSNGRLVTHRIIEVITDDTGAVSYKTKGDNPQNDPDPDLVQPKDIKAKLILKVPFF